MHTNHDVLALLALGENSGSSSDHHHLLNCAYCQAELADLRHVTALARTGALEGRLEEPPERVWLDIRRVLAGVASSGTARTEHDDSLAADPDIAPGTADPTVPAPAPSSAPAPHDGTVHAADDRTGRTDSARSGTERGEAAPLRDQSSETSGVRRSRSRGGRRALSFGLAAGLSLIAGIGIGVAWDRSRVPGQIVGRADLQALPEWSGAAGTAVVRQDSSGTRTLIVTLDTPQPVGGNVQVWLLTPDASGMQPVGFINGERGFWAIPNGLDLDRFPVVDVSGEPTNDTDSTHSGNSIVRGRIAQ